MRAPAITVGVIDQGRAGKDRAWLRMRAATKIAPPSPAGSTLTLRTPAAFFLQGLGSEISSIAGSNCEQTASAKKTSNELQLSVDQH
jgi:hypothetical protein